MSGRVEFEVVISNNVDADHNDVNDNFSG